jgi:hypothetical protein
MGCQPSPVNKRAYITDIGRILVKDHGRKKYYTPEEVKRAHNKRKGYDTVEMVDFSCWAIATFSSHTDFDNYHKQIDEPCEYSEMKAEMLQGLSSGEVVSWIDIPGIDLDASWMDFGEVFGGIVEGIGEFFGGIADGL